MRYVGGPGIVVRESGARRCVASVASCMAAVVGDSVPEHCHGLPVSVWLCARLIPSRTSLQMISAACTHGPQRNRRSGPCGSPQLRQQPSASTKSRRATRNGSIPKGRTCVRIASTRHPISLATDDLWSHLSLLSQVEPRPPAARNPRAIRSALLSPLYRGEACLGSPAEAGRLPATLHGRQASLVPAPVRVAVTIRPWFTSSLLIAVRQKRQKPHHAGTQTSVGRPPVSRRSTRTRPRRPNNCSA